MAAVAINQVVRLSLRDPSISWPDVWKSYLHVLNHPEIESISWRHLYITLNACVKLFEEFEEELCVIVTPLLEGLSIKPMTLIFSAFLEAETKDEMKFIFYRETMELIFEAAFKFITRVHDEKVLEPDFQSLEAVLIQNIDATMKPR